MWINKATLLRGAKHREEEYTSIPLFCGATVEWLL